MPIARLGVPAGRCALWYSGPGSRVMARHKTLRAALHTCVRALPQRGNAGHTMATPEPWWPFAMHDIVVCGCQQTAEPKRRVWHTRCCSLLAYYGMARHCIVDCGLSFVNVITYQAPGTVDSRCMSMSLSGSDLDAMRCDGKAGTYEMQMVNLNVIYW